MKQKLLYRIRVFNKYVTNKILIHVAGKRFGHFAIIYHTGRKNRTQYQTPIIVEPIENGFVIALTYGRKVDWLANVMSIGCCTLRWKNQGFQLVQPELIGLHTGLTAFPAILQPFLRKAGVKEFLRLTKARVSSP